MISSAEEGFHGYAGEAIGTTPHRTATSWSCSRARVVGQPTALQFIIPYIQMYQAGLSRAGSPRRHLPAAGSDRDRQDADGRSARRNSARQRQESAQDRLRRVSRSDHEVAKLIGAPPGYVGHRETKPLLTQERLQAS